MDGRVKTLHPKVHGGLLAIRDNAEHAAAMKAAWDRADRSAGGQPLSVRGDGGEGAAFDDCIENIDIGGPAMIRAAAKNHDDVAVVVESTDYAAVLDELAVNAGATTLALRQSSGRQGLCPHRRLRCRDLELVRRSA